LQYPIHIGGCKGLAHLLGRMPVHNMNAIWRQRLCGMQNMAQQGLSSDGVQDLGLGRLHARSRASRENDDV
jgi:hypothetical protein